MKLLTYAQIDTKYGNGEDLNPIEKFIYEHEQAAHQESLFRDLLINALLFAQNEQPCRCDNCGNIVNDVLCDECDNELSEKEG